MLAHILAVFLNERLRIKVIPSIALIRDNKPIDYVVGFTDLGNTDEFKTEMLEWRIARSGVIEYSGDLLNPPDAAPSKKHINQKAKSSIRGSKYNDNSSDEDD